MSPWYLRLRWEQPRSCKFPGNCFPLSILGWICVGTVKGWESLEEVLNGSALGESIYPSLLVTIMIKNGR